MTLPTPQQAEYWRNQIRRDLWGTQVSDVASTINYLKDRVVTAMRLTTPQIRTGEPLTIDGLSLNHWFMRKAAAAGLEADKRRRQRKRKPGERAALKATMRKRASDEFQRIRKLEEWARSANMPWGKVYATGMAR